MAHIPLALRAGRIRRRRLIGYDCVGPGVLRSFLIMSDKANLAFNALCPAFCYIIGVLLPS